MNKYNQNNKEKQNTTINQDKLIICYRLDTQNQRKIHITKKHTNN